MISDHTNISVRVSMVSTREKKRNGHIIVMRHCTSGPNSGDVTNNVTVEEHRQLYSTICAPELYVCNYELFFLLVGACGC